MRQLHPTRSVPLYGRIALLVTLLALVTGVGFVYLSHWSSNLYHQEVTQSLHRNLAEYVLDHQPEPLLDSSGKINKSGLKAIAMNTMMINPAVEVYLLNNQGDILGHALPEATVSPQRIAIQPIQEFLQDAIRGPILGMNPRDPENSSIFSVAPLNQDGQQLGYLYIVLASHQAQSMAEQFSDSHVLRVTIGALLAIILFFGTATLFSFNYYTRPLKKLAQQVRSYRKQQFTEPTPELSIRDEVLELEFSISLMQERIQQQFDQLGENDRLRRELISNVSHDLRTPLASMQGYLETLLLKYAELDEKQKKRYLDVAHRHSRQMNALVSQLFELAKLDAGRIEPELEVFSLTELLYDLKQDYELLAQNENVSIEVGPISDHALVKADIGLMQRVLQNLMDNALRYTPAGGTIAIGLKVEDHQVRIDFADSGAGIPQDELPFVFERFYQAQPTESKSKPIGAGLGLSIVKKILDLHGSVIRVDSTPMVGTTFSFCLPCHG